jgi:flagella basal body P-ring formation protein FlgA
MMKPSAVSHQPSATERRSNFALRYFSLLMADACRLTALFSCLFLLGFAVRLSAGEPVTFQLRANAQADSTGIFLNQIVESAQPLPAVRLCDSPAFGKIAAFTRDQIATLLHDAGSDTLVPSVTNWTGADTIRISRRARAFTETDLLNLLTETLQRDYVKDKGELELRMTRSWSEVILPDEPLTLKILEIPTSGVTPAFISRFEIRTAREGVGIWQANVQARIWREVWVAHSAIKRGESLASADVTRERRDVLPVREALADFQTPDSQLEFAEPVIASAPLLNRVLKPKAVVHRGQAAQALFQDGALSVIMKVEVLDDGAPGQIVRARNPISRRDVRGKVLDEQTIQITL